MFELYDKVRLKGDLEDYFIIDIDEGDSGVLYGIEKDDQYADDWFRWVEESQLIKA